MNTNKNEHRVVLTGMGAITPLGHDVETIWANLLAGKCGIRPTEHFDAATFPTQFSAQVVDYDYRNFVEHPEYHEHAGLNTRFALGAARQAWANSGLDKVADLDRDRIGLYLGSGEGTLDFENYVATNLKAWDPDKRAIDAVKWAQAARGAFDVYRETEQEANMTLAHVAMELGVSGPAYNCLTACAASTQAIGEAYEILRRGDADVMISGGAHSMIHPLGVTGFNRLTALSTRNDSCITASRPFNRTRDGFVLGEGSGMVVLETLEHAKARGATILAELIGYGSSADAYRITDIHPEGRGPIGAMRQALKQAGLEPTDIDYISAHGTGTKENDSIETRAVKAVFGDAAKSIPVSSVKSMLGHLIAAAGAVELITCLLAMRDSKIPPTINLHEPDPDLDLDYVPNAARDRQVDVALSNSFGFGGQNDTVIIRRFDA
ncbi:beta-ketoacyl-[acyl-carrier-protein] synthase family protein [Planctomycetales bacterium ZRK34]|nr:beta-ketoacyl-[acyl-carrier-protein] synthase family protein [Planctomycetales bacterium ZRK34]